MKFKKGDVVVLKSGGPSMTVGAYHENYQGDDRLVCMWFKDGERKAETFYEDQLELETE